MIYFPVHNYTQACLIFRHESGSSPTRLCCILEIRRRSESEAKKQPVQGIINQKTMKIPSIGFFAIFIFSFFIASAVKCEEKQAVRWTPHWNVGDQFTVEMTQKQSQKISTGDFTSTEKMLISIEIKEKGDDFYILHWTYGDAEPEKEIKTDPFAVQLRNLKKNIRMVVKTDLNGKPKELVNAKEFMEQKEKEIDKLKKIGTEINLPDDVLEQVVTKHRKQNENPEIVSLSELHDIIQFFLFSSGDFIPEQDQEVVGQPKIHPMFGGLTMKCRAKLMKPNEKSNVFRIKYHQEIDKEKKLPFDMIDDAVYQIDKLNGWPIVIEFKKEIQREGKTLGTFDIKFRTVKMKPEK